MLKSRINKFIYPDQKMFFRLKTMARNLKLKKIESSYSLDFELASDKSQRESVNVSLLEEFRFPDTVYSEALKVGYEESDLETLPGNGAVVEDYKWGRFIELSSPEEPKMMYYYLAPEKQTCGIKVGPVSQKLLGTDLQIDWPNVQWNFE